MKNIKFYSVLFLSLLICSAFLNGQGTIVATGSVTNTAGNSLIPSVGAGGCSAAPQNVASGGGAAGTAWLGGTVFTATLPALGPCTGYQVASVNVNATHSFLNDVDMFLRNRRTGQIINLTTDNGGGNDNFSNVKFCENPGCISISGFTGPFTGGYRPEGGLSSSVCGSEPAPNITTFSAFAIASGDIFELIIYDDLGGDAGAMISWSVVVAAPALEVTIPAPSTISFPAGTCVVS